MIAFHLPVVPVGQMRARARTVKPGLATVYTHSKQRARQGELIRHLKPHVPSAPLAGPLEIEIVCYLPVPKSWTKANCTSALMGHIRPDKKPDADNLAKHLLDAMTAAGFWLDDAQVVELSVKKYYGDAAGWIVRLGEAKKDGGSNGER